MLYSDTSLIQYQFWTQREIFTKILIWAFWNCDKVLSGSCPVLVQTRDWKRINFEVKFVQEKTLSLHESKRHIFQTHVADPALEFSFALVRFKRPKWKTVAKSALCVKIWSILWKRNNIFMYAKPIWKFKFNLLYIDYCWLLEDTFLFLGLYSNLEEQNYF